MLQFHTGGDTSERIRNIPTTMTRCARPPSPSLPSSSSVSSLSDHENEDLQRLDQAPPFWKNPNTKKKVLSKQVSLCEVPRDMAWERRCRQILSQRRNGLRNVKTNKESNDNTCNETKIVLDHGVTDEDMNELKGCIELGFGFNEEQGQKLCPTIPALDLYFAVHRQFLSSPVSSPNSRGGSPNVANVGGHSSSFVASPRGDSDSWKICSPGESPEHVKTKLRHWAQAVACSVRQSS